MKRLLVCGGAAILIATCAGRAAGMPGAKLFTASSQPVAGKRFPGLALVLPPQAKSWQSFHATCMAWAAHRRLPAKKTASPEHAAVPNAVVCSWRIPRKTAGKELRARVATDAVLADGTLEHDEGQLVTWTIQRR